MYDYNEIYSECIKLYPDMKDIVEYIKEISPVEKGERIVLYRKMQNGDKAAKKRIIDSYLPITLRLSMEAAIKSDMPIRDLFSDAVIGLCDKLVKYNEDEFSILTSYVLRGVNHALQKHIRSFKYDFPISKTVFEAIPKVKEAKHCCSGIMNHELISQISQITSLPSYMVRQALLCSEIPLCYDELYNDAWYDGERQILDYIERMEIRDIIKGFFSYSRTWESQYYSGLTDREYKVIRLRYGLFDNDRYSLSETADMFFLSEKRVRQIEGRALAKLRKLRSLRDYIGFEK